MCNDAALIRASSLPLANFFICDPIFTPISSNIFNKGENPSLKLQVARNAGIPIIFASQTYVLERIAKELKLLLFCEYQRIAAANHLKKDVNVLAHIKFSTLSTFGL